MNSMSRMHFFLEIDDVMCGRSIVYEPVAAGDNFGDGNSLSQGVGRKV